MIKIMAGICPECGDTIFSRTQHDCRYCSCKHCFIDGGSYIVGDKHSYGYIRTQGNPIPTKVHLEFNSIHEAKKALYEDWNKNSDKYGLIKGEK